MIKYSDQYNLEGCGMNERRMRILVSRMSKQKVRIIVTISQLVMGLVISKGETFEHDR